MNLKEFVVNNIALAVITAVENQVDGAELSKKLDELMDKKFDLGLSEKLQRGPLANFLLELVEGLYAEEPEEGLKRAEIWASHLRKEIVTSGKNPHL